jgi:hypothetical protein
MAVLAGAGLHVQGKPEGEQLARDFGRDGDASFVAAGLVEHTDRERHRCLPEQRLVGRVATGQRGGLKALNAYSADTDIKLRCRPLNNAVASWKLVA